MVCPICHKRKAKRFCPAKGENICSLCCGTEREVTIDCPADCPHLIASRQYDYEHKEIDWSKLPFCESKMQTSFLDEHEGPAPGLAYARSPSTSEHCALLDAGVLPRR